MLKQEEGRLNPEMITKYLRHRRPVKQWDTWHDLEEEKGGDSKGKNSRHNQNKLSPHRSNDDKTCKLEGKKWSSAGNCSFDVYIITATGRGKSIVLSCCKFEPASFAGRTQSNLVCVSKIMAGEGS